MNITLLLAAGHELTAKKLPVQGVDSDALESLVRSFYTGAVPLSLEAAPGVYDAATKLEVRLILLAWLRPGLTLQLSGAANRALPYPVPVHQET